MAAQKCYPGRQRRCWTRIRKVQEDGTQIRVWGMSWSKLGIGSFLWEVGGPWWEGGAVKNYVVALLNRGWFQSTPHPKWESCNRYISYQLLCDDLGVGHLWLRPPFLHEVSKASYLADFNLDFKSALFCLLQADHMVKGRRVPRCGKLEGGWWLHHFWWDTSLHPTET